MVKPSDLDAMPSDEYELGVPTSGPKPPSSPTPLPRSWKSEPSEPESTTQPAKPRQSRGQGSEPSTRRTSSPDEFPRSSRGSSQNKSTSEASETGDKKRVLVEDTPEWDTYETRRRTRLVLGLAMGAIVFLTGWISYRLMIYDPNAVDPDDGLASSLPVAPQAAPNLDAEARAMIDRAKEYDTIGNRKESVALLEKLIKVYPKVPTAQLAKNALERANLNEPLFPEAPAEPVPSDPNSAVPPNNAAPTFKLADPSKGLATMPPPAQADAGGIRLQDPARGLAANVPAPSPTMPMAPSALGLPRPQAQPQPAQTVAPPPAPPVRHLPRGFHARTDAGLHESGWPNVIINDLDGEPMILIPEGTFIMGANNGPLVEEPAHRVELRAFYIDQHEVTIGQFEKFLDKTGFRRLMPRNWSPTDGKEKPNPLNPIVMVTYREAEAYANWSHRELPSEAQWEMAARSEKSSLYPWGSEPVTWKKPREFRQVDPVMSFPQDVTPRGVFDLAGNVAEWTQDWYDANYYQQFANNVAVDPMGPSKGSRSLQRSVKGASKNWSVSYREGIPQEKRLSYVGFRCVLNVDVRPQAAPNSQPVPSRPEPAPVIPF